MIYDGCYCGFKDDADSKIICMEYLGNGKYKCPKCNNIEDFSGIIYTVTLKYEKKIDEDYEWIEASIIKPYDKRLNGKLFEDSKKTIKENIENDMLEYEFALEHDMGVFTTDVLYNWHNDYSPEYGNSWDLDLEIIKEEKINE